MARPLRIVLIGSSTAAGVGADPPANGWANRYRAYLVSLHPRSELINLASPGLQTFHLLPTGHLPPPKRPLPDAARNLSRALTFRPDAVLVQVPSNDAAAYYGAQEQLDNYDLMAAYALRQEVPIWFFTPQPRRFSPEQVRIQSELYCAMKARYTPFVIDVWSPLADEAGGLLPQYDCGDGAHLNNAGHEQVLQQVLKADLPKALRRPGRCLVRLRRQLSLPTETAQTTLPAIYSLRERLSAFVRLVRGANLLIVAAAQAIPYWGVLEPAVVRAGAVPILDAHRYGLLGGATVAAAAAGYVFNDYTDYPMDVRNRQDRVVVGRQYSVQAAMGTYIALLALTIGLAAFLSVSLSAAWPAMVFAGVSLLLWTYSRWLKCTPLWGNVAVALLCGLVPLLPMWAEYPLLEEVKRTASTWVSRAEAVVWSYACLAFGATLWREQVKDLEDLSGDAACGCRTLPERLGLSTAKKLACATGLLFAVLVGALFGAGVGRGLPFGAAMLILPVMWLVVRLWKAAERSHFAQVSRAIKVLMVVGMLLLWMLGKA